MANTEDTFDPNDLESIDALLDEAELEAVSQESEEEPAAEPVDNGAEEDSWDNLPDVEESSTENDVVDDLIDDIEEAVEEPPQEDILDALDDLELSDEPSELEQATEAVEEEIPQDPEPEVVGVSEPVAVDKPAKEKTQQMNNSAVEDDKAVDDFLEKRAKANSEKNKNLSVEEMESIKKLVVIFGSVLSVLVLIAIGMGVWAALAASKPGVDEDTKTLIESIKVSGDKSGSAIVNNEKLIVSVEKKLDAINFQIEQMVADIAELEKPKEKEVIDPLGLGNMPKTETKPAQVAQPMKPAVVAANDPELMKKVSTVSSRLYRAQKKIDEINKRLKAMQSQSSQLAKSMKLIEKEALLNQAERDAKAAEEQKLKEMRDLNPYNYSAPDGGFYDQSVSDSYP